MNHQVLTSLTAPTYQSKLNCGVSQIRIRQDGFTLIELMVALTLGLLISAAVLQIYLTSAINANRQQAGSQIQDNAIFAIDTLKKHIRRANYGAQATGDNDRYFMNHLTHQGGVVLTAPPAPPWDASTNINDGNLFGLRWATGAIPATVLSANASANSASNLAGLANSDQLTIQYQADRANSFDCQGRVIPQNYYVIERYFVRPDTTVTPNTNGLACASAIYEYEQAAVTAGTGIDISSYTAPGATTATPNNLIGNGTIVVPNVDYFRVLLGVSNSSNFAIAPDLASIGYIPIPAPADFDTVFRTPDPDRRIVSIQIGLLTHSDTAISNRQQNADLRFNILDKTGNNAAGERLNTAAVAGPKYLRNVYESTILIRNARGGV